MSAASTLQPSASPANLGPPPGLLLAALLFWGWQTGELWLGVGAGLLLESHRLLRWRWDPRDEDFRRLWNFTFLLLLAVLIYRFSRDESAAGLGGPAAAVARQAGLSGLNAGMGLMRLLPLVWCPFLLAQNFSTRGVVPLAVISWLVRYWQRRDQIVWRDPAAHLGYPYFLVCLFAASIHLNDDNNPWYLLGVMALTIWASWPLRARRVSPVAWGVALALALGLAYVGAHALGRLEQWANNYNARWLTRLMQARMEPDQTRTSLGQIGQLKLSGTIVVRVEPLDHSPAPIYLRAASFRKFASQVWQTAGRSNAYVSVYAEPTNDASWVLLSGPTRPAAARISAYLDGWSREAQEPEGPLPLPSGCNRLDALPAYALKHNAFGAVLATGPELVTYDAHFGPGPTFDSPPDLVGDLQIPPEESNAVAQVAVRLAVDQADDDHKLLAVQQFFAQNFTYSLKIPPRPDGVTNTTPIADFLLRTHVGYCEYFATATVLLLRQLHLPARYAIGYVVHEKSGSGYVVRERDAHAWCLIWNPRQRAWQEYDTTPAAPEDNSWHPAQSLDDLWAWLKFQWSRLWSGQFELRKYALWLLLPVLGLSLLQIIFRRQRRARAARPATAVPPPDWPGLDSEFYHLTARLAELGLPRQPDEPLGPWLERVLADPSLVAPRESLQRLLRLHYRFRFDPAGLSPAERAELAREVTQCLAQLGPPKPN